MEALLKAERRNLQDCGPPLGAAVWLRSFGQLLDDALHVFDAQQVAGAGRRVTGDGGGDGLLR